MVIVVVVHRKESQQWLAASVQCSSFAWWGCCGDVASQIGSLAFCKQSSPDLAKQLTAHLHELAAPMILLIHARSLTFPRTFVEIAIIRHLLLHLLSKPRGLRSTASRGEQV